MTCPQPRSPALRSPAARNPLLGRIFIHEAYRLPARLFDYDLSWNSESGEETHRWVPAPLGRTVREALPAHKT